MVFNVKHFCDKCNRGFSRRVHLQTHIDKIHNTNPFVDIYRCRACGNEYKYKKNCVAHARKNHDILPKNRPLKRKIVNPSLSGCFVKVMRFDADTLLARLSGEITSENGEDLPQPNIQGSLDSIDEIEIDTGDNSIDSGISSFDEIEVPSSINSGNGLDPLVMVIIPCNSQALADVKNELNTDSDEPLDLTVKKSVVSIHDEDEPLDLSMKPNTIFPEFK